MHATKSPGRVRTFPAIFCFEPEDGRKKAQAAQKRISVEAGLQSRWFNRACCLSGRSLASPEACAAAIGVFGRGRAWECLQIRRTGFDRCIGWPCSVHCRLDSSHGSECHAL